MRIFGVFENIASGLETTQPLELNRQKTMQCLTALIMAIVFFAPTPTVAQEAIQRLSPDASCIEENQSAQALAPDRQAPQLAPLNRPAWLIAEAGAVAAGPDAKKRPGEGVLPGATGQAAERLDLEIILPPSFGPHSARAEFAARLNRVQFNGYADWRYPTETERALLDAAGIVQPEPPSKAGWSPDQVLSGVLPKLQYVTGWIVAHHWSTLHGGYVRSIATHQVFAVRNHSD